MVNSGLIPVINALPEQTGNSLTLLLLGGFGKIGINCFMLTTRYFMCTKEISYKKLLKIFFMLEFHKILIYLLFVVSGYEAFSLKGAFKAIVPLLNIKYGFLSAFIIFFMFIPFWNILIKGMTQKQHLHLVLLNVGVVSLWPSLIIPQVLVTYVGWFSILYLVAAYLRLYPLAWFDKRAVWGWLSLGMLSLCLLSMVFCVMSGRFSIYAFVADSNKFLALLSLIAFFMYFRLLKLPYIKTINLTASACLGVLLIHANSDTMRQWLWQDVGNNVGWLDSPYCILHCLGFCLLVYLVCTILELLRIRLIETLVFNFISKKLPMIK